MKSLLIAAVLLFFSTQLHGEPRLWMFRMEPETLRYEVDVESECPISTPALEEMVKGILIRSRLKPQVYLDVEQLERATATEKTMYLQQERFGFRVGLGCMEIPSQAGWFVYRLDIRFVRYLPDLQRNVYESEPYGAFGLNDEIGLNVKVKERVEALVTDYLQANFDLTPE